MASLRDRFPLQLTIGHQDYTFLLAESFSFSNVDPGGFEMASFAMPKDLPEIVRGMPVRLNCGLRVAWEGRVKEVQRSLGAKTLIQCEGYGARLKDQETSMVFVDRDLTRWGGLTTARLLSLTEANWTQGSASVAPAEGSNTPAIVQKIVGAWASPAKPQVESWYDAGPENLINAIYYNLASNPNATAPAFIEVIWVQGPEQTSGTFEGTGNLHPSSSGLWTPTKKLRRGQLQFAYNETPAGADAYEYFATWSELAVYGTHGLTLRGSGPYGLYAGDIVRWVAEKCEGIKPGVINEASFYTVPHAVYYVPIEQQQIVADMAKLVGYHWGVWESLNYLTTNQEPRLDFRPYPGENEPTAYTMRRDCETLDIREDLSSQYNTAQVSFSEASGEQGEVKVSVPNPILETAGISDRTVSLNLGLATPASAEAYGELALEVLQLQARVVGAASISESVRTMMGGELPPWMLRSGIDQLRIPDLPSFDVWGQYNSLPISRVECSGGPSGIKTNVEFGLGKNLLEALTAQLQQAAILAGQGG